MKFQEAVDAALAGYHGMSLQGVSLGADEWQGFIAETGLKPDDFGQLHYKGIPISEGIDGVKLIVGD